MGTLARHVTVLYSMLRTEAAAIGEASPGVEAERKFLPSVCCDPVRCSWHLPRLHKSPRVQLHCIRTQFVYSTPLRGGVCRAPRELRYRAWCGVPSPPSTPGRRGSQGGAMRRTGARSAAGECATHAAVSRLGLGGRRLGVGGGLAVSCCHTCDASPPTPRCSPGAVVSKVAATIFSQRSARRAK